MLKDSWFGNMLFETVIRAGLALRPSALLPKMEVVLSVVLRTTVVALTWWIVSPAAAQEWPQWGRNDTRNMVSLATHLPSSFMPGTKRSDGSGIDLKTAKNIRWIATLGSETYSTPAVADGRVIIGTNDCNLGDSRYQSTRGGLVLCLNETTGKVIWRLVVPKLEGTWKSSQFDEMDLGVCSAPTIDGDRVYLVTNRCEVVCLDIHGMANGNDGPFTDEGRYTVGPNKPPVKPGPRDADILWYYDIIGQLKVWPHDAANCSVLVHGDLLYVGTGNGVDGEKAPSPLAPSLIVLDKKTGRLVGWDDEKIGARVFHGQWSSPSLGEVNGKTLVFYGAGDGVCYAFEALEHVPEKPRALVTAWSFQCNPPEYRFRNGKPIDYWDGDKRNHRGNRDDGQYLGPNEIIGTPVFWRNRVFASIGQDPVHGRAKGALHCIDATKTGDISQTGKIWSYTDLDRSVSTVSIADGLLYTADRPGRVYCLDAETGRRYWVHDTKAEIWGSTLVADGKVFVGTRKAFWVLAAGKEPKVLGQIRLGTPSWASPVAASNVLYVASMRYLWAVSGSNSAMLTNSDDDQPLPSRDKTGATASP